ncbi:MAG TPA: hypothetical protein VE075_11860, partial [Thermoanaerobaculia bacterium]|nr:hypothetical protein [Thermoanaerobaculia bacterium]
LEALPEIVARLGRRRHAPRRRAAARRLDVFRQRLRTLRWASDSVSLPRHAPDAHTARLKAVRAGLASLSRDLA